LEAKDLFVKEDAALYGVKEPKIFEETDLGKIYHGDSLGLLHNVLKPNSVDLIVTSPPFGLGRKKSYGNERQSLLDRSCGRSGLQSG
jgi:DNA modification methylase